MMTPSTFKLVAIGIASSAFFSATFLLNEVMHLRGGDWVWSAVLRFIFMILLLSAILPLTKGAQYFRTVLTSYFRNIRFWIVAGGIGFGLFYSGICLAADYAQGWIVAATWQVTVLASPLVLMLFGKSVPRKGLVYSFLIVAGVAIVNYGRLKGGVSLDEVLHGVLPALVAAVTYPIGNQMVNGARHGQLGRFRLVNGAILENPMTCVLLMSLGSIPYWIGLILFMRPQVFDSFLVALLSGVCATSLFYFARNSTASAMQIAAVDATLAGEVVITLFAGMLFMGELAPDWISWLGVGVIVFSLIGYCYKSSL
jgi:drug/metabolite transporter (DMT)-like permease